MKRGKWDIPDHVLESIARCFLPDIVAFYNSEEGKQFRQQYQAEKEKLQSNGANATHQPKSGKDSA